MRAKHTGVTRHLAAALRKDLLLARWELVVGALCVAAVLLLHAIGGVDAFPLAHRMANAAVSAGWVVFIATPIIAVELFDREQSRETGEFLKSLTAPWAISFISKTAVATGFAVLAASLVLTAYLLSRMADSPVAPGTSAGLAESATWLVASGAAFMGVSVLLRVRGCGRIPSLVLSAGLLLSLWIVLVRIMLSGALSPDKVVPLHAFICLAVAAAAFAAAMKRYTARVEC